MREPSLPAKPGDAASQEAGLELLDMLRDPLAVHSLHPTAVTAVLLGRRPGLSSLLFLSLIPATLVLIPASWLGPWAVVGLAAAAVTGYPMGICAYVLALAEGEAGPGLRARLARAARRGGPLWLLAGANLAVVLVLAASGANTAIQYLVGLVGIFALVCLSTAWSPSLLLDEGGVGATLASTWSRMRYQAPEGQRVRFWQAEGAGAVLKGAAAVLVGMVLVAAGCAAVGLGRYVNLFFLPVNALVFLLSSGISMVQHLVMVTARDERSPLPAHAGPEALEAESSRAPDG